MRGTLLVVIAAACTPPALLSELKVAEKHVHAGEYEQAMAAYDRAVVSCLNIEDEAKRRTTCGHAHLGRAELLDRMGRREDAAAAYEATPDALDRDPVPSATAVYRAGKLRLELGQEVKGYELLWRAVTDYPDAPAADYALREVVIDGRRRDVVQLYQVLGQLATHLGDTEVGDNLLYWMAELARNDFSDDAAALQLLDRIADGYPKGALFDDALWHGAAIARSEGDPSGAVTRYRRLLKTREVAWFTGSYNSEWFDDSWLQMGITLRDDLENYSGALKAFRMIPEDYPASILRDDAMWERAVTYERMGKGERACKALQTLHKKWPDSKYELERAPKLREQLSCTL